MAKSIRNRRRGLTRKTKKGSYLKRRKISRHHTRKMRGGRCFGNGVGSNNYDPNFSIYNTNMLKLFPYKA